MHFLIIVLLSLITTTAFAQEKVGKTKTVTPAAHGTVAGTLAVDSDIHSSETIATDKGGKAGLEFKDNTKMDIGPQSSVKIDRFVYDPNTGTAAATLNVTKGSFRYVTGATGIKGSYKVKTPFGTLGVRG